MIIVQILGGLGNQLFQYAFGRALAHRHGTDLKYDRGQFAYDELREFQLDLYPIAAHEATVQECCTLTGWPFTRLDRLKSRLLGNKLKDSYIKEKGSYFDPALLTLPDNVYVEGYFQSPLYFDAIRPMLVKELTPKNEPSEANQRVLDQARGVASVSLHVRRGDYVSDPATEKKFNVCDLDYYRRAVNLIRERVENPHFFVFSDDIEWAKANLQFLETTTFVDHNGVESAHEDIRIMNHCRHNVIANSSFSWWGAWLGDPRERIVVAPSRWSANGTLVTENRVPENWLQV